jgi:membrane-bound ClpP family serine protease
MSWLGAALILVAFLFLALDLIVTNHGMPTFGGIVALVLGVLTSYDPASSYSLAALVVLVALAALLLVVFVASSSGALAARGKPPETGAEGMVGEIGVVRETVGADSAGWVFVHGELWRAIPVVSPEDAYDDEQDHEQKIGVGRRVQVVGFGDGSVMVMPFEPAPIEC